MSTPVERILEHLDAVRAAYQGGRTHQQAFDHLVSTCPALAGMEYNTFRTRAPLVLEVAEWLHRGYQARIAALRAELAEAKPETVQPPKSFEGWSVQIGKDGYTRLYKKLGGKVKTLYVGRGWNEKKARGLIVHVVP